MRNTVSRIFLAAILIVAAATAEAKALTPAQWVESLWPAAKAAGVSRSVYDAALGDFTPDPDIVKKAAIQAEFNMPIWNYIDMMVSDERINGGKAALVKYADTLARIEERYSV